MQSRYYNPEMGRFISADSYASTGQGVLGYNMFAYCNNNPIVHKDTDGEAAETVFDIISLGASIADVAINPTDPWAWASLAGDLIDVAVPFVGGIGEAVKLCGIVDDTKDVVSAAKKAKELVSTSTGSYEILFKSGQTYVGKGSFSRAIFSANSKATKYHDEVASITWKKAKNAREAYVNEYISMCKYGGPNNRTINNTRSYNAIWSPGRRYYYQQLGKYYDDGVTIW